MVNFSGGEHKLCLVYVLTLFLGMTSLWRWFPQTACLALQPIPRPFTVSPLGLYAPWENRGITHNKTPNRAGHRSTFSHLALGEYRAKKNVHGLYTIINLGFSWCQQVLGLSSLHGLVYEIFERIFWICEVVSLWPFVASVFLTDSALEDSAIYWLRFCSHEYFPRKSRERCSSCLWQNI